MSDEMERQELGQGSPELAEGVTGQVAVTPEMPTAGTPETTIAEADRARKPDLTEFPEFRAWQSQRDREAAELRRQLQEQQAELARLDALRQQAEEQRLLEQAEPDEVIAYYKGQLAKQRADLERQQTQAEQQSQVQAAAAALLSDLGLEMNTPGLDWGGGPSAEGYARLAESAARLIAQRGHGAVSQAATEAQRIAREARQAAIAETGATRVSTATGAPLPSNAISDINDPDELLKMAMKKKGG